MERDQYTDLEQLPNVGPAIAGNLRRIGIAVPDDLVGRDPYDMYDDLCQVTGTRHDPCVLDVFIAAVRFMAGEPATPWWAYTAERKAAFVSRNPQGRKAKGTDMPSIAYVQSALQHHYQNASRLDARINLHAKAISEKEHLSWRSMAMWTGPLPPPSGGRLEGGTAWTAAPPCHDCLRSCPSPRLPPLGGGPHPQLRGGSRRLRMETPGETFSEITLPFCLLVSEEV